MEKEDTFLHILSDDVTLAMLTRIVETGGCTLKDILDTDAVKEEFRLLIETMEECGLIERIDDTVQLTEKGLKFSELREGLKEVIEVQKEGRDQHEIYFSKDYSCDPSKNQRVNLSRT